MIPEKYKDLDFTPPKGAQDAAKKALEWKDKYGNKVKGGTKIGWTRANQLASGKPLSPNIVRRMARFIRHKSNAKVDPKYKNEPWRDAGFIAYKIWGDQVGIDWAKRLVDRMNKIDSQKKESFQLKIKQLKDYIEVI